MAKEVAIPGSVRPRSPQVVIGESGLAADQEDSNCWSDLRRQPSFFFSVPEKTPRTVWRCQPVALATSPTVAPRVDAASLSPRVASTDALCRMQAPDPAISRLPTTADLSAHRGRQPSSVFSAPGKAIHNARSRLPQVRNNDDLALIDCGQRLAAQGDSVIANDVNAHGGFSWLPRPQCRR